MFNERLQEALKKRNISGNALCKKLGIDNKNYTNWNNNKIPRGETLKEIAEILEVSIDWLLEKDKAPEPDEVQLLKNYQACDEAGKETIISVAELQAKRCRKVVTWKQTADEEQDEQDELKPFA